MTEKIKLTGQLLNDKSPTTLAIEENLSKIEPIVKEYQSTFGDELFLKCEWGYFKKPISQQKALALANLFHILNSPLQNVLASIAQSYKR